MLSKLFGNSNTTTSIHPLSNDQDDSKLVDAIDNLKELMNKIENTKWPRLQSNHLLDILHQESIAIRKASQAAVTDLESITTYLSKHLQMSATLDSVYKHITEQGKIPRTWLTAKNLPAKMSLDAFTGFLEKKWINVCNVLYQLREDVMKVDLGMMVDPFRFVRSFVLDHVRDSGIDADIVCEAKVLLFNFGCQSENNVGIFLTSK